MGERGFMAQSCVGRIFVLILFMKCCAHSAQAETRQCDALIDSGDAHYAKFDNRIALDCYRRAFALCPEYPGLMKMTRAFVDFGEDLASKDSKKLFATGLRYADTLQRRYPDSVQSYFLGAVAAGSLAQIGNAIESVKMGKIAQFNANKTMTMDPGLPEAYVVLGVYDRRVALASPLQRTIARILFGALPNGSLEDSRGLLKKALEISPENVFANLELSRTFIALKDTIDAQVLLERMQAMPEVWHLDRKLKAQGLALLKHIRKK